MSPGELLVVARRLVATSNEATKGRWARAAAALARQALEAHVRALLLERAPGAQAAPMRSQLLCLEGVLPDDERARGLAYTWYRLSEALHHHAYELPPTAEELNAWIGTVEECMRRS